MAAKFVPTHSGTLLGDARTGNKQPTVMLRETARYWITSAGVKYRKSTGWPTGGDSWPLWTLNITSVRKNKA
jgi:hypothetical protein